MPASPPITARSFFSNSLAFSSIDSCSLSRASSSDWMYLVFSSFVSVLGEIRSRRLFIGLFAFGDMDMTFLWSWSMLASFGSDLLKLKGCTLLLMGEIVFSGDNKEIFCEFRRAGDVGESRLELLAFVSAINFLACSRSRCWRDSSLSSAFPLSLWNFSISSFAFSLWILCRLTIFWKCKQFSLDIAKCQYVWNKFTHIIHNNRWCDAVSRRIRVFFLTNNSAIWSYNALASTNLIINCCHVTDQVGSLCKKLMFDIM